MENTSSYIQNLSYNRLKEINKEVKAEVKSIKDKTAKMEQDQKKLEQMRLVQEKKIEYLKALNKIFIISISKIGINKIKIGKRPQPVKLRSRSLLLCYALYFGEKRAKIPNLCLTKSLIYDII